MKKFYVTKKQVNKYIEGKLQYHTYEVLLKAVIGVLDYLDYKDEKVYNQSQIKFYTRVKERLEELTNIINQSFIVGVVYNETIKRPNGFGYMEEETNCKDKSILDIFIKQNRPYRYFDKYGNEYTIEDIKKY